MKTKAITLAFLAAFALASALPATASKSAKLAKVALGQFVTTAHACGR